MAARYPERIVCLTEETTETLYLLGEERRIVGISGYTVRPARARKEKPRVSAFLSARTEKIMELKPDLVIGFSDLQADIARDLTKRGLNVLIFNQRSRLRPRSVFAGRSTTSTSAPMSASSMPANGAGPIDSNSSTRIPANGPMV